MFSWALPMLSTNYPSSQRYTTQCLCAYEDRHSTTREAPFKPFVPYRNNNVDTGRDAETAQAEHTRPTGAYMPGHIAVVHDDPAFIERVLTALTAAGYDVAAFMNTMRVIEALEGA